MTHPLVGSQSTYSSYYVYTLLLSKRLILKKLQHFQTYSQKYVRIIVALLKLTLSKQLGDISIMQIYYDSRLYFKKKMKALNYLLKLQSKYRKL